MFNVGGIQATIELAGEALFTSAVNRAKAALEAINGTARTAAAGLGELEAATASASEQAAVLDESLDEVVQRNEEASEASTSFSDEQQQAMSDVGEAALGMGTAVAAGVGIAIYRYAEFDQAMSRVQAANGATGKTYEALRENAIQLGADSSFSAKEAAEGQEELAKAGVETAEILGGGLKGALDLAAAGSISVADAAETAATAMTQFKLSGEDVPHLADLLAAGANKAQGGVGEMSMALKQGGLVAAQMGLSVEETVGSLTAFAAAGLLGSDAGTSLKTMLLALANPSKESAELMKELGINAYDAQGNFVGMTSIAGQLTETFKGKTQAERDSALATIFGSDAIRAASILYQNGAAGIEEWNDKVNDSGAAARTAATLQDNLSGDVEKLGGAFDALLISAGAVADGPLRELVQWLTGLIDLFGALPDGVSQTILVIGAAGAVISILGGAALAATPKVLALQASIKTLGGVGGASLLALERMLAFLGGPWGIAFAAAAVAVGFFLTTQMRAQQQVEALRGSLDKASGAVTDYTRDLVAQNLAARDSFLWMSGSSVYDDAEKIGASLQDVTDAALGNEDAYNRIKEARQAYIDASKEGGPTEDLVEWTALTDRIDKQRDSLTGAQEKQEQMAQATRDATAAVEEETEATSGSADAMQEAADQTAGYRDKLNELITAITDYNSINQTAEEANIALQQTYADLDQRVSDAKSGVEGFGLGIDVATQAGRDNRSALIQMAQASQDAAQKALDAGGSVESFRGSLEGGRAKLIEYARQLGASDAQADALADAIFRIPTQKEFTAIANTAVAIQQANALAAAIQNIPSLKQTTIRQMIQTTGADPGLVKSAYNAEGSVTVPGGGGQVRYFARGGFMENHTAQIYSSGITRVFNEPETGGELYAPLAQSKRSRSREILAQGAALFGDHYMTDGDVAALAAGGGGGGQGLVGLGVQGEVTFDPATMIGTMRGVVIDVMTQEADTARAGVR